MPGPLSGITVLDFTWALAGPFGTMVLADLGADIWKVEPLHQTEEDRGPGPMVHGINTYFFSVNRGKKSIMLDLKAPEARDVVDALVQGVDVLTENFSPGTMERLGFGQERLRALNPALIYASTSGFGQTGPYRNRGAVDVIVQGMGGVMSITGHPDGPPARPGYSIGDLAAGLFTAIGVLAALVERSGSGAGQYVDVAMLDSQVALMENAIVRYAATGVVPGPIGTRHPLHTPFQAFPGKDGWIVIAGVKDWTLFCARIERDDLIFDERFATRTARNAHHAELEPLLFDTFRTRTVDEWIAELADVCLIGPLNTVDRVVADPQVQHRDMIVELPTWNGGSLSVAGTPVKLSRTTAAPAGGAARPGEHTAAILAEAGLSAQQIQDLIARGIVATREDDGAGRTEDWS